MPTNKPRLIVTLEPALYAKVKSVARPNGTGLSAAARDLFIVTSALSPKPLQHEFFYSNDPPRWEAKDGRVLHVREVVGAIASYG